MHINKRRCRLWSGMIYIVMVVQLLFLGAVHTFLLELRARTEDAATDSFPTVEPCACELPRAGFQLQEKMAHALGAC